MIRGVRSVVNLAIFRAVAGQVGVGAAVGRVEEGMFIWEA